MLIFSNKSKLSHLVFLFSITITILAIIPALFPALYASTNQQSVISQFITENAINPFEPGMFFIPIIVTWIATIVFFVVIKLKSVKIRSIDLPKKYSIIAMVIILSVFTIISYDDVISEDQHKDWILVKDAVENWPPEEGWGFNLHVRFFMLSSSLLVFGNYRVIPFLASVALLVTTYLFANKITNNRFAGVIAAAIVLQSNLFLSYSSTPSYTVFWILFYLVSLYLTVHKTWFLSPVAYITSLFSKPLTITFFPISIFFMLDAEISVKKKIILVIAMLTIIIVGVTTLDTHTTNEWDWNGFWNGFVSLAYQLRFDGFVVVFLIPTIIGLYIISKNNRYANSVSIMISGVIISNPILLAMTDITSQPYRFIPLLIFLAIGVGMILTRKKEPEDIKKIKRVSKKSKQR